MRSMKERTKNRWIILIVVILVTSISIGFAAYSSVLTISSNLKVTPDKKYFKVNFSSAANDLQTNPIEPTKSDPNMVTTAAVIDNTEDPTIKNLSAVFTEPGQYVEYSFYAYNTGKYTAFLNGVLFGNVNGKDSKKVCTPLIGARPDLVERVCGDIKITVDINSSTFNDTTDTIENHTLERNSAEPIKVKFTYVNNDNYADGDFEVSFGDITLNYSSVD